MIGYKVFNEDWTCKDFQYKVGETYTYDGEIVPCKAGFHFCEHLVNCYDYYGFNKNNKVALIEATGKTIQDKNKTVTDKITIVKELSWDEVQKLVNFGANNTGLKNIGNNNKGSNNSGNHNDGYDNTGNKNIGDHNAGGMNRGHFNTGVRNMGWNNSGSRNIGDYNTGEGNRGDYNVGDFNYGDGNTGDFNKVSSSTGLFNTKEEKMMMFNKPSNWTYDDWSNSEARSILHSKCKPTMWDHNKNKLIAFTYEEMWENAWSNMTDSEKQLVKDLPNFDAEIFKEITGIDISIDEDNEKFKEYGEIRKDTGISYTFIESGNTLMLKAGFRTPEVIQKLNVLFHNSYYNTNQNTQDFALEFYYLIEALGAGHIPLALEYLAVDEIYDDILEILEKAKAVSEDTKLHLYDETAHCTSASGTTIPATPVFHETKEEESPQSSGDTR